MKNIPRGRHGLKHVYLNTGKFGIMKADGNLFKDPGSTDPKEKASNKPELHWGAMAGFQKGGADLQPHIERKDAKKIIAKGQKKYLKLKAIAEAKQKEQLSEIAQHIKAEKVKEEKASSSSSSSSSSGTRTRKSIRKGQKAMKKRSK